MLWGMDWSRVDAVADELSATRAEVLGLVLLVLGGVVVSWLVVRADGPAVVASGPTTVATPSTPASPSVGPVATGSPVAVDDGSLVVHVTGAVVSAGVVELAGGARVVDAVTAVGGPTADAALDALNMARPVVDGERVHVPTPDEVAAGIDVASGPGPPDASGAPGQAGAVRDAGGRLDLNLATPADLEELPGVGPVLAERIVAWRDGNGGFEAVGQLREVSGIGERTFQDLADLVVVG